MNCVVIILDGLRQDALFRLYKQKQLKGGLGYLIDRGVMCMNVYANGCPTQFSAPSIFTSTLPLDHGGYDRGIINRPIHIAELLQKKGYYTLGFATGPWETEVYGYHRGFDDFFHTFDIFHFIDPIINHIYKSYYQRLVSKNPRLFASIKKERKEFIQFAISYILDVLNGNIRIILPKHFYPFRPEIYHNRIKYYEDVLKIDNKILNLEVKPISFLKKKPPILERIVMTVMNRLKPYLITPQSEFFPTLYLKGLLDVSLKKFREPTIRKPQFHCIHALDLHEKRHTDGMFQLNYPFQNPYGSDKKRYALYDDTLRYVDKVLGCYIQELRRQSILSKTAFVVLGDHGFHDGFPSRSSLGLPVSNTCDIYHESLDCGLVFFKPGLKPTTLDKHCSLIDVSPTILDMLGFKPEERFKGQSVFDSNYQEKVISESCGKGPCHLPTKPIYMSIKLPPYKLIFREFFHMNETIRKPFELYKLDDRYELNDLAEDPMYSKELKRLILLAQTRIDEVRRNRGNALHKFLKKDI